MSAWWVVYAVGVVALAASEVWLARAGSERGASRWGLVHPPWRAVALRVVGAAAVLAVAIWRIESLLWVVVAVASAWLPGVVAVMVLRRRRGGERESA